MVSWNEIENESRRSRSVRILRLAVLIAVICYLTFHFGDYVKQLLQEHQAMIFGEEIDDKDVELEDTAVENVPAQTDPPKTPLDTKLTETDNSLAQVDSRSDIPRQAPKVSKDDLDIFAAPAVNQAENEELAQAEFADILNAISTLQEKLESQFKLDEIGGEEWVKINALVERGKSTLKTDVAIQLAGRAHQLLMELPPKLQWRQLVFDLRQSPNSGRADILLEFSRTYAEHERREEAKELLREIAPVTWVQKAEEQNSASAVTDGGVAESWIVISDSWKLLSENSLSNLALFRARTAVSKMTEAERAVESGISLTAAAPLVLDVGTWIESVEKLVDSVSSPHLRRVYWAELAALAQKHGFDKLSERLTSAACNNVGLTDTFAKHYSPQYRRCQVLSYSENSDAIHEIA
ncbi:MAG: hypothetical protein AAGG44_13315, partial [Planctomycetota bacterium]